MRGDDLADGICVDETGEEDEGDEVVVEDFGVEIEVGEDQSPGCEEWEETDEGIAGLVPLGAAGFNYVLSPKSNANLLAFVSWPMAWLEGNYRARHTIVLY